MNTLSLLFIGDCNFNDSRKQIDEKSSRHILRNILPFLKEADFRIANLENPLVSPENQLPIEKVGPYQTGLPQNVGFFTEAGIDCAVLANNHMGDMGIDGCMETVEVLDKKCIGHAGAGVDIDEAYKAWRAEKNGIRISVIAVCENEFGTAGYDTPGSAGFELGRLFRKICEERKFADYVLIVYHGGNEYNPVPSPGTVERFRLLCDFGADGVIGMHTHCPQGNELYKGKPIIYSMGNFFFNHTPSYVDLTMWHTGYMTSITFEKGKSPEVKLIPTQFDKNKTTIIPLRNETRQVFLEYIYQLSEVIHAPDRHMKIYKAWCELDGKAKGYYINPEFWEDGYDREMLLRMKNRLFCEAFHEILQTSIMMLINKEFPVPKAWHDDLAMLRKLPEGCSKSLERLDSDYGY